MKRTSGDARLQVADRAAGGYRCAMKLTGTIRRSDLEGGHWTFEATDGKTYQLSGSIAAAKDGAKADAEGEVDKGAMGVGMTGPMFKVSKLTLT
jgi:hypothetical protein